MAKRVDLACANEWKGNDSKQADAPCVRQQTRFPKYVCVYTTQCKSMLCALYKHRVEKELGAIQQ